MKLLPQDNNDLDSPTDSIKMETNQVEQRSGLKGSQIQIHQGESKFFKSECSSLNSSIVSYDSESDLDLSWENVESFERNKYLKAPSLSKIKTNGHKTVKVAKL